MARKLRVEVEGGLYHVIARGNDRQDIFHSHEDRLKFLSLLAKQKARSPFFVYAFCLMTNHIHLLLERQIDTVGNLMQRVLGGYSRYYNRKYKHVGHVFQARHKSILCQRDRYLAELVRYIHLNPVRAGMVKQPEDHPYSSHREYLGLAEPGLADVDPVLRLFGSHRMAARSAFVAYVMRGMGIRYPADFDSPAEGYILGSEDFVDETIHRIGDTPRRRSEHSKQKVRRFDAAALIAAVAAVFGLSSEQFCGPEKSGKAILAKEVLILIGREQGATVNQLSLIAGLDTSNISRRCDAARLRFDTDRRLSYAKAEAEKIYLANIAESQT
ncbi:MAG: transposase [Pyrinomonadaceae bacterium]